MAGSMRSDIYSGLVATSADDDLRPVGFSGQFEEYQMHGTLRKIALVLSLLVCHMAQADGQDAPADRGEPVSVWLNLGFLSHHFQRNRGFRENNYGFGMQAAVSQAHSLLVGDFRNSDDAHSRYAYWAWQPLELGAIRLGLAAGATDGYPKMRNGKWFLAAIPMASVEHKAIGLNFTVIPGYKDRLHAAAVAQIKLRVW